MSKICIQIKLTGQCSQSLSPFLSNYGADQDAKALHMEEFPLAPNWPARKTKQCILADCFTKLLGQWKI